MKTLTQQTLLYDDDCPLCSLYTSGFIAAGMLDENGKKPYCKLSKEEYLFVDIKRAANEIALVDTKNKKVIYGIDSLLKVIGHSFPWVEKVGNLKMVKYFLKKLYAIISYNRKVIVPNKIKPGAKLCCLPDYSYKYRLIYLTVAATITTITLCNFNDLVNSLPKTNIVRELILVISQMVFQGIFFLNSDKKTTINYLGNLITVSLMGSIMLSPILLLNSITVLPQFLILTWFIITVAAMFFEHARRLKTLALPYYLSITWVIYSIIALIIILKLSI